LVPQFSLCYCSSHGASSSTTNEPALDKARPSVPDHSVSTRLYMVTLLDIVASQAPPTLEKSSHNPRLPLYPTPLHTSFMALARANLPVLTTRGYALPRRPPEIIPLCPFILLQSHLRSTLAVCRRVSAELMISSVRLLHLRSRPTRAEPTSEPVHSLSSSLETQPVRRPALVLPTLWSQT